MRSNGGIPVWEGATYPRIPPGRYTAAATRIQGPELVRQYRSWKLFVEFELLGEKEPTRVCAFYNLGDGAQMKVGRRSRYFQEWTIANGAMPLTKQRMDPQVFMEGQVYEIEVDDCRNNAKGEPKSEEEIYSRVTRIVSANRGNHPSNQAGIFEVVKQEATKHASKQATKQGGQQAGARKVSPERKLSAANGMFREP